MIGIQLEAAWRFAMILAVPIAQPGWDDGCFEIYLEAHGTWKPLVHGPITLVILSVTGLM